MGFTKGTIALGVSLPLSPDFGPAEACPWGQAELQRSASSLGLCFFLPEPARRWMHRAWFRVSWRS